MKLNKKKGIKIKLEGIGLYNYGHVNKDQIKVGLILNRSYRKFYDPKEDILRSNQVQFIFRGRYDIKDDCPIFELLENSVTK